MNSRAEEPRSRLYLDWVFANAWSELVGLGGSMMLGFLLFARLDDSQPGVIIGGAVFAIVAGALLEGALVGFAQAKVLAASGLSVAQSAWVKATTVGAGVAWALGMIPSTVAALVLPASDAASEPVAEPEGWLMIALAAAMGLVLGPVLSFPQAMVLKRHVDRAWRWVPANALAWAIGMAIVFAGAGSVPADATALRIGVVLAVSCTAAGVAVGAIHGIWVLRFVEDRRRPALREP